MKLGQLLLCGLLVDLSASCNLIFSEGNGQSKDAVSSSDAAFPPSHIARAFVRATVGAPFVTTTWQNLGSADVDITIDRGQGFVPVRWIAADAFTLDVDGTTPYRLHVVEHLDDWRRASLPVDYDSTERAVELKVSAALGRAGQTPASSQSTQNITGPSIPVTAGVNNVYIASSGIWTFTLVPANQKPDGSYQATPNQPWTPSKPAVPGTDMMGGYLQPPLGLLEAAEGDKLLLEKWANVPPGNSPPTPSMFRMEGFQAASQLKMPTELVRPFTGDFIDPITVERHCIAPTYDAPMDASALATVTPIQAQPPPPAPTMVFSSWSVGATPAPEIGGDGGLALVNGITTKLTGNQIVFGNPHQGHRGLTALASLHSYNDPAGSANLSLTNLFVYYILLPTPTSSCFAFSAPPRPDLIDDLVLGTTELNAKASLTERQIRHGGAATLSLRWSAATTPNLTAVDVYKRVGTASTVFEHRINTRNNEVKLDVAWFNPAATYVIQISRLHGANMGGDFRSVNYPFTQMARWTATFKVVP